MVDMRANVGRIMVGTKEFAYCEDIEVNHDYGLIKQFAGDWALPIYVAPGNAECTITIGTLEYNASSEYADEIITQNGLPVTVELFQGVRGGGIAPAVFPNCVVGSYVITSKQGDMVKAKVILSQMANAS